MILGTAADVAGLAKSAWVTYSGPLAGGAVEEWARATAAGLVKGAGGSATTATTTTTAADLQRQHAADVAAAPPPPPIPAMLPESAKAGGRSDVGDILKATSLSFQYALQAEATHAEPGARDAFAAWAGLVAVAHPLRACRDGAASLVASLPRAWPAPAASALGPPPSPDPSLAAGHPDGAAGGEAWLAGVAAYVKHFFQCSECAAHFTDMASGADAAAVATRSDAVLWAWRAHNRVNARLAATEAATPGDGDPAHPKAPWPPRALCPGCSAPAPGPSGVPQWNEAAVADFLVRWYRAEDGAGGGATGGGGFGGGAPALPRRALGDAHGASSEGSRPLLLLAIVGLVCAAVVAATRPPPVRRGMKAAAH